MDDFCCTIALSPEHRHSQRCRLRLTWSPKYGPLLPVLGLQDKYDVFISYRQRGNTGLVLTLHPRLEHHGLVTFVDANNLETGVNFKHACMAALQHSVVACPVVSVAAIHKMRSLDHLDKCDNVLLEWMAVLELQQLAHEHPHKIRLCRIIPLFLGSGWHDSNSHSLSVASASEYDSFDRMKRLAMTLPDVVNRKIIAALDQYFARVLHLPPPQQHKTVREVVLSLFDMDGITSFQYEVDRAMDASRIAERVRKAVAACNGGGSSSSNNNSNSNSSNSNHNSSSNHHSNHNSNSNSNHGCQQRQPQAASPMSSSSPSVLPSSTATTTAVSSFEPKLQAWLDHHSLLPQVAPALAEHDIDTLDDLVELVVGEMLTVQVLTDAGVTMGKANKLIRLAKKHHQEQQHSTGSSSSA